MWLIVFHTDFQRVIARLECNAYSLGPAARGDNIHSAQFPVSTFTLCTLAQYNVRKLVELKQTKSSTKRQSTAG